MERAILVTTFAAAMGTAIVGGMFYAFSSFVMRALARIAPEQGVAAMNSINVVVITPSFMVVFVGTALLCLALAAMAVFAWQQPGSQLVLAASLLYLVGNFGLTMRLNQPMNLRLAALPSAEALAYWAQYLQAWTMWNHVRTAAALLAAALFITALMRS
ncbi:MAG: DUF1772 domain-containing protein [Burkholderiales bacterium]|nr:DUF1772 domain-containing protein [Burkholderiales bacterium]